MAIAIRGTTPASTSGAGDPTSLTLTGTRQPQANDVLLIIHSNDFYAQSNIPTPTVGGSTTGVVSATSGDGGTNGAHSAAWTFVCASTGDLTVAVDETGAADEDKALIVYVLSGVDNATPVDQAAGAVNTGSTTHNAPSLTGLSTSDAFLICHTNTGGGASSGSYTPPSGMSESYDFVASSGGMSTGGATLQLASSAATGTKTFSPAGACANNSQLSIAMRTAGGGAPAVATPGPIVATAAALRAAQVRHRAQPTPPTVSISRAPVIAPLTPGTVPVVAQATALRAAQQAYHRPRPAQRFPTPAAAGPSTVAWVPAEFQLEAVAPTLTPGPVTTAWTPAEFTLEAQLWGITPQPVTVAWTPAEFTIEAQPWTPIPQPVTMAWTPASFTLEAVPLTATPGAVSVAWTAAEYTLEAVQWTVTPQPVVVAWVPGEFTLTVGDVAPLVLGTVTWIPGTFTLTVGDVAPVSTLTWTPAEYVLELGSLTPTPQPVTILWTPASFQLEAVPVGLAPAGPITMAWTPAEFVLEAVPWLLSTIPVPRWTILRALPPEPDLTGEGPDPDLVAYQRGGLVEHTLKEGDVRTLRYDMRRDLTGVSTVVFHVADDQGGPLIINRAATIVDAAAGLVDLAILDTDYGAGKLELSARYPIRRPFLLEAVTGPVPVTHPNRGQEVLWLEQALA